MTKLYGIVCLLGWLAVTLASRQANAQYAQQVLSSSSGLETAAPTAVSPESFMQLGVRLPSCPYHRILSNEGVPGNWSKLSMEEQVTHPINAMIVQLAYAVWQDDPAAKLGRCLDNMGIDPSSLKIIHKYVFPYLGTMTALVMRAGDNGVFVSFRGTDFEDPGDVLVDADCAHTTDVGRLFGIQRNNTRLHSGFYRAWESLAPSVTATIEKQLQLTRSKKVYIIGHSLGGSIAAIAALRLNHEWRGKDAEVGGVWLIGCPRIGNRVWMEEYNSQLLDRTLRMSNFADFASRLPMQLQVCTSSTLLNMYEFRHVGKSLVLCPNGLTGLVNWHMFPNGSEALDCSRGIDTPDLTVTTHWLGPYLDAWRRGYVSALNTNLAQDPHVLSVMCDECSLSFPTNRNKQLNVPARAGGPIGCCTSASCSMRFAWYAAARIGAAAVTKQFNPVSTCVGYICT